MEWRCFNGWEMVLHSILGGGETEDEVVFVEEEANWGMPFLLLCFWDLFLPLWVAAPKAPWCVPFEVLLPWS